MTTPPEPGQKIWEKMKIIINESQYNRLLKEEVDVRLVKNITNLTDYILSVIGDKERFYKQSEIDILDYDDETIVIAVNNDELTFIFDNELDEAPYYRPGTYEDPPEGSDGIWILKPLKLKYEKEFDGEMITVYDGKDFTKFVEKLPSWLDEEIQNIFRKNWEDRY